MKLRGLLSIALATTLISPVVSLRSDAAELTVEKLGVFRGSGKSDQVTEYENWLGKPVAYTLDFIGRASATASDPWDKIDDPSWVCNQWRGRSSRLILSTAMLPNTRFSLAAGAGGDYDSHWRQFGQTMVARGCQDTVIRLGWEFNGKFFPWAAGGKEASFVAYWRRIVNTLRNIPNQQFLFDWCPLAGVENANVEAAWPGAQYVDFIGLDAYDTADTSITDPAKRWAFQVSRPYGLDWLQQFVTDKQKPMSFPEWGITVRDGDDLGGGDNPNYIARMLEWISAHDVAYASYFEVDAAEADHRLMTNQFPKASAEYRRLVRAAG